MALREPTKAEAKKIRHLMDSLMDIHVRSTDIPVRERPTHKKVRDFLASFPKDVRFDTVYKFGKTGNYLYADLMNGRYLQADIDLIKQVGDRTPDITRISPETGETVLEEAKGWLNHAIKFKLPEAQEWQKRFDLATQLENEHKERKAKALAKPLVSLTKTAKDPLAQKGLSEETESRIASFLTGNKGTVPEQLKSIRQTIGKGRRRRRRTRRTAK